MQRRDKIALEKIISEMDTGIHFLENTSLEEFMSDELLKRALSMTAINIGELVKVLTAELRSSYKTFPWKAVAGMRDIAAHRYQTLRMEDVYVTVRNEYPVLKKQLEEILQKELQQEEFQQKESQNRNNKADPEQ